MINRTHNAMLFRIILVLCAVGFYIVVMRFDEINILSEQSYIIGLFLTGFFVLAGAIVAAQAPPPAKFGSAPSIRREVARDGLVTYVFALAMVAGLMALRGTLLYYLSGDYAAHLSQWVAGVRGLTVRQGLSVNVGNYNMPYMYLIFLISRFEFPGMFLIKFASIFFDIILAYFVMKIVSLKTESRNFRIAAFLGALAIPTVVINSAMWAQSDAIYAAFTMGAIYFALAEKSKLAYLFLALGFAFKMQAMFVAPLFVVFILKQKIWLRDIWIFPVAFLATLLPAVTAGMPIRDALATYSNQFDYYNMLNMNATSIWRLVGWVDQDQFIAAGLFVAGVAVAGLLYFVYVYRKRITETKDYVNLAYIFAAMMPFLLPKMHDRFLFLADVLSILVFAFNKKRWFVPLITIYASYNTYVWFLMSQITLIDYVYVSLALGVTILIVLKDFVEKVREEKSDPPMKKEDFLS